MLRRDIRHYSVITELQNPSNELIIEWGGIYCGFEYNSSSDELDLNQYWLGMSQQLPLFSKIALERSFSKYNSLLDSDCQNLSIDLLKKLNMMYFNS